MSSTIEVLVSFKSTKRIMTLPTGSKLDTLREEFIKVFSDVIKGGTTATDYDFKVFDRRFQEYVDLNEDREITDGDKLIAQEVGDNNPFVVPHAIKGDITYCMWSLTSQVKGSLMKRDNTTMKCNGTMKTSDAVLVNIKAEDVSTVGKTRFRLQLADPKNSAKLYVITGTGEGQDVYAQVDIDASNPPPADSKFEPIYYFSYTQFRCDSVNGETDLYLASDENGKTTLAKGGQSGYPNPATLYICNQMT